MELDVALKSLGLVVIAIIAMRLALAWCLRKLLGMIEQRVPPHVDDNRCRFSPELFENRTQVMEALQEAGFDWPTHYSSVDPLHDVYGIEVCGIVDEDDAFAIKKLLQRMYPSWRAGCPCNCYQEYGREPGFRAKVQRDSDRPDENWETE